MKLKVFVFILLTAASVFAQPKVIDGIAAVVNNEIILKSELDYQVKLTAAQQKISPDTPGSRKRC